MLAGVFVHHVVGGKTIFIQILRLAILEVLYLRALAFNPIAHNRSAEKPQHGGDSPATAASDRIAQCATGQCTDRRAGSGPLIRHHNGFVTADRAWHGHLLHHRRTGDNAPYFLSGAQPTGQNRNGRHDTGFHGTLLERNTHTTEFKAHPLKCNWRQVKQA